MSIVYVACFTDPTRYDSHSCIGVYKTKDAALEAIIINYIDAFGLSTEDNKLELDDLVNDLKNGFVARTSGYNYRIEESKYFNQ